jgi:2-methylfumaryl-CoA isomerase
MTLAQLGAEVIRIDPVGGAPDAGRWPLAPPGAGAARGTLPGSGE